MVSLPKLYMVLWRISTYASLDGSGGLRVSGRWHSKGHPVVYCSQNPRTVLLETLTHFGIDEEDRLDNFRVLKVEGPDLLFQETIDSSTLQEGWERDFTISQPIGDRWLSEGRTCLLKVPSVLVEDRFDVLLNPLHFEAKMLQIASAYKHEFPMQTG